MKKRIEMSILKEIYTNKKDKVWYDSSNILFSECYDNDNDFKLLKVVFNNGYTYLYKNVDVNDYLMFKYGGTDGSNGKALNKFIKNKYEYERIENSNIDEIENELNSLTCNNCYFISGHRDLTQDEFNTNYAPIIKDIIDNDNDCKFIMGDYVGADIMAQNYLLDTLDISPERVIVYHMGNAPMNVNNKVINFIGEFVSDEDRDAAMTNASIRDIAFVRDHTKWSGTAQNILRRFLLKKII